MANVMEVKGNDNAVALVYGNAPDANEFKQIFALLTCPAFANAQVRIMPDHHAGAGCVIGFTSQIDADNPMVVPNVVGVDIGCGVHTVPVGEGPTREEHFLKLDTFIRQHVPSGFSVHSSPLDEKDMGYLYEALMPGAWLTFREKIEALSQKVGTNLSRVLCSLGSLGGGNHFIEMGRDADGQTWLTVHSGSRNLGLQVANYHQRKAQAANPFGALSWLDGNAAREYLDDMRVAQEYAALNRALMLYTILSLYENRAHTRRDMVNPHESAAVLSVHNYIDNGGMIRKGAVSAREGERVVIPWNMRDGMVVGAGRGNADWNYSAPHGAGRKMGRKEAKNTLSVEDYREAMKDVWSSCVGKSTIDEAPDAYKPTEDAVSALVDTVVVHQNVLPIYNFKANGPE